MLRSVAVMLALAPGCVIGGGAEAPSPTGKGGSGTGSGSAAGSGDTATAFVFHPGVESSTGRLDLDNALALVTLDDLAYLDPAAIPAALRVRGVDPDAGHYRAFADSGTEAFAYYVEADGAAFVVFRGTELNWQNITQDIDFLPADEVTGQVMQGFQIPIDSLWSDVHDAVAARQASAGLPLYVTGHSLGAAMATIATARMLLDADDGTLAVTALYAFASPRVGEGTFANTLAHAMADQGVVFARVVNDCDPVTNVPERVGPDLIPFYEHVSLGTNENDFVAWLPKGGALARSIPLTACPLAGFDYDFPEHLSPAYIAAIDAVL